ncbi:MAG: CYTH domain-containing protein [Treponema sp.]|jgi:predicted adenylyl cyclase CyaB|nr:CYTH domain-containing protein [Treponema sp.]
MKNAEIELKTHVDNPDDCKKKLSALAGKGTVFSKDDTYWDGRNFSGLRVRRETAGEESGHIWVTWKNKERRGSLEVNDEHEFEVSDGTGFEELLTLLGLEKRIRKHKQGWIWHYRGITAELCEVSGSEESADFKNLGWFLELEIKHGPPPENSGKTVEAAQEQLLALLEKTGIGKECIESRYYAELFAELTTPQHE